jgi:hypothetical protein
MAGGFVMSTDNSSTTETKEKKGKNKKKERRRSQVPPLMQGTPGCRIARYDHDSGNWVVPRAGTAAFDLVLGTRTAPTPVPVRRR